MKLQKPAPLFVSWKTNLSQKRFRVAKFKQRREVKTRDYLGTLANVQIGGCTGLSYTWVQRHRCWPGYHIVHMIFDDEVTGHICALHTGVAGMRFLVPNSGGHVVGPGQEKTFLRALTKQYKDYVSPTGQKKELNFRHLYFCHLD